MAWNWMTSWRPGRISGTDVDPQRALRGAQGAVPSTEKKTAPLSLTARSTSDSTSGGGQLPGFGLPAVNSGWVIMGSLPSAAHNQLPRSGTACSFPRCRRKERMSKEVETRGRCFCGAVEIRVTGKPVTMGYDHCSSCREWSAAPVNAFTLWPPDAVSITRGKERLGALPEDRAERPPLLHELRRPRPDRAPRVGCGRRVRRDHPRFPFEAKVHVNYGETVLRMRDGLPKQNDFPRGDGRDRGP